MAIFLVESVLVLALVALIIMSTGWFQHVLEHRVVAGIEDLTGGRVEIGYFRFRPWLFQVTTRELVIHGSEGPGEYPLISVREVDAGLRPTQLLRRRLRLRYLDTEGIEVHLRTDAQGATNLPGAGQPASSHEGLAGLMNLSIGRLTISHAVFFWNDQRQSFDLNATDLAILLSMGRGVYDGTLSSSATTLRSPHWSSPPVKFTSRFEASHASLVFSSFAWQMPGEEGVASFTILPLPALCVSGSFHTSTDVSFLSRVLKAPALREGNLVVDGTGVYEDGHLTAQGQAHARKVAILASGSRPLLLEVTSNYAWEKAQLNLSDLLVSIWGGTVQGSLQADFRNSQDRFRLSSQVRQVRLEQFLNSASGPSAFVAQLHPVSIAAGGLNAAWSGRGQGLEANFDLGFAAPAVAPFNTLPINGTARGTLREGSGWVLQLDASRFETPHSTLSAQGTLAEHALPSNPADPLAVTASTDRFEEWQPLIQSLAELPSPIPLELKSRAEVSGQLSGGLDAPSFQGNVNLGEFQYQGWAWDGLRAGVTLNPSFVQLANGRIQRGKSSLELNASVQLSHWQATPSSRMRFSAQAQSTPLGGLKAAVNSDIPVLGSISGQLEIEGTRANLAGIGALRIDSGTLYNEPFDSFSTQVQVANSVWKFQNLRLSKGRGNLHGELTLEPERNFASGQLTGSDFLLSDLYTLPIHRSSAATHGNLEGRLGFEARGSGTPEEFHLQCPWRIQDLSISGTPLGELSGSLNGEGKELTLEANDKSPAGNLHFTARTTAEGNWPMTAEGEYSGLRADPWIRSLFSREFAAQVMLGGALHAAGPLRTPEEIKFQSHATDVEVDFPSIQWRNDQPLDVRYANDNLGFTRFVMRGPSTELGIEGNVNFRHGGALAFTAEGTANATLLTVFDPHLQATGRSTLHLRLAGTSARPLMNGSMDIQDLSLGYSGLPFSLNSLQGTIQLEGERAVIRSLRGTSGGGTASLTGFVTLVESPRYEVNAELRQVRIRYPPMFTSVFDGNLRFAGGIGQAQLQGDLVVHQMVQNENGNILTKFFEASSPMGEQPGIGSSPIASMIRLNIRVTSNPPVQLQTPNLRMVGDIDMRLQGSVANPVEVGTIHFLSGETIFRGNRYTLVRGDMNMTNPFRTQAYLDIEAQTQVQNYNLTLDITGPFDRLKFSYRSDPPLAQTDIISLLALGYVPQEGALPALQGNPTTSIGASAILSEALSSQIGGRIQHLFGVSRIKIDPDVGMPGLSSGERVTVEEQITHDLTLTYITDTAYSQYTIVQFELNIGNNMSILGVRDPNGVFGIEFRFHHRFK